MLFIFRRLALLALLSWSFVGASQTIISAGSTGNDRLTCVTHSIDGSGVIYAGHSDGFGFADQDIVIHKMDDNQNLVWSRRMEHAGIDEPYDLITTTDGNYILTGYVNLSGVDQFFIMKFDDLGAVLWQRVYVGSFDSKAYEVVEANYGSGQTYFVVGYQAIIGRGRDGLLLMFEENGTYLGGRNIGTTADDEFRGIDDAGTGPIVIGYTAVDGTNDILYHTMDSDGSLFSTTLYDGGADDVGIDILHRTTGGGFQWAGNSNSFGGSGYDIVFLGENQFATEWNARYGSDDDEYIINQINYGGTGVGYTGYYEDASGNKNGILLFTDWGGNNEGSSQLYSCDGDEIVYDAATIGLNKHAYSATTNRTPTGTFDYVTNFIDNWAFSTNGGDCITDDFSQSRASGINWVRRAGGAEFTDNLLSNAASINSPSFTLSDYTITFENYCGLTIPTSATTGLPDTIKACADDQLIELVDDFDTYAWSNGVNGTKSITVNTTDTYKVMVTDGSCTYQDSTYVYFPDNNLGIITSENNLCLDSAYRFTTTLPYENIDWDFDDPGSGVDNTLTGDTVYHSFSTSGQFTVTASATTSCNSVIPLQSIVNVNPGPTFDLKDSVACGYAVDLDATTIGATSYLWNTGSTDPEIRVYRSGKYKVEITDGTCTYLDSAEITIDDYQLYAHDKWAFSQNIGIDFSSGSPQPFTGPTESGGLTGVLTYKDVTYTVSHSYLWQDDQEIVNMEFGSGGMQPALVLVPDEAVDSILIISMENENINLHPVDVSGATAVVRPRSIITGDFIHKIAGYYYEDQTYVVVQYGQAMYVYSLKQDFTLELVSTSFTELAEFQNSGFFKFSPDGKWMVSMANGDVGLYQFDVATGELTFEEKWLFFPSEGAEFSPDGTKLYLSNKGDGEIFQYDLTQTGKIATTETLIDLNGANASMNYMELGPDGQIYVFHTGLSAASVISNPNASAPDVGFQFSSLSLTSAPLGSGLVNYPRGERNFDPKLTSNVVCEGNTSVVNISNPNLSNLTWSFDTNEGTEVNSDNTSLEIDFDAGGTYDVNAEYVELVCNIPQVRTLTEEVVVGSEPFFDIEDIDNCVSFTHTVENPIANPDSVMWSDGSTSQSLLVTEDGKYYLTVYQNGCFHTDTFTVSLTTPSGTYYSGDKRTNVWYFGNGGGLDFNSGTPVAASGHPMNTKEGVATICDTLGNLLFYTDGRTVYDKNNDVMTNGTNLLGDNSSTQSSIIVPHPGDPDLYYVFTTPATEEGGIEVGFNYNLVDMSRNGGLGEVMEKNQLLFTPSTEKVTAVAHGNRTDIWVIAHKAESNRYYAYLVDENGLNTEPVVSNVGSTMEGVGDAHSRGILKASPNGKKLAVAMEQLGYEILDFDNYTGEISNPVFVDEIADGSIVVEFSPSSQFVYLVDYQVQTLYQIDVSLPTAAEINASLTAVTSKATLIGLGGKEGLQLGPDGRIYSTEGRDNTAVSVIPNPDLKGAAAGYLLNEIDLGGGIARLRFPNMITSYFSPDASVQQPVIEANNLCEGDVTDFEVTNNVPVLGWDFGDPSSSSNSAGAVSDTAHIYSASGDFTVTYTYTLNCGVTKDAELDVVIEAYPLTENVDTAICGDTYSITPKFSGDEYTWTEASSPSSEIGTTASLDIFESGVYNVDISRNGCASTSTYEVELDKIPYTTLDDEYFICSDDGETVELDPGGDPVISYRWDDSGLENAPLEITMPGTYRLTTFGDTLCELEHIIEVSEQCAPELYVPKAFTINGDGLNDELEFFGYYLTAFKIQIFNQWGEVVFMTEDENETWDGTYLGELLGTDTFAWTAEYSGFENGKEVTKQKSGEVTLLR